MILAKTARKNSNKIDRVQVEISSIFKQIKSFSKNGMTRMHWVIDEMIRTDDYDAIVTKLKNAGYSIDQHIFFKDELEISW